jgi:hypothetical protein
LRQYSIVPFRLNICRPARRNEILSCSDIPRKRWRHSVKRRPFGAAHPRSAQQFASVIRRYQCRRCPSDGAYGAEIHKLRADGVDDSGSVFGQVWTIHVSDKVVAPQSRRTVSRGHDKM